MNKKRLVQIMSGVLLGVLAVLILVFSNSLKQVSSYETITMQQPTIKQQKTKATKVVKKVKKKKKAKKKTPLFPKKYKKLKVVKTSDETETKQQNDIDDIAEVYKEKSLSASEEGVAVAGCIVQVESVDKNWTKIQSNKVEGYIESKYIVKGKEAKQVLLDTEHILAKIKKKNVNIKNETNKNGVSIGIAYANTTYPIVEISKDEKWVKIKRTEKMSGWIPASEMKLKLDKEYVYTSEEYDEMVESEWKADAGTYKLEKSKLPKDGEARELIEYASRFLGNRYVWGGTSLTKGADCSGFVQSVFRHFGYHLDRTAAEQAKNEETEEEQEETTTEWCKEVTDEQYDSL